MKNKLALFFAFVVSMVGTLAISGKAHAHERTVLKGVTVTAPEPGEPTEHTEDASH